MKTTQRGKAMQMRQGDVFVRKIRKLPDGLKPCAAKDGRHVLAYGEATGHSHSISELDGTLSIDAEGRMFLRTEAGCELVHQEHAPIKIPAGDYSVTIQREYQPAGFRNVMD